MDLNTRFIKTIIIASFLMTPAVFAKCDLDSNSIIGKTIIAKGGVTMKYASGSSKQVKRRTDLLLNSFISTDKAGRVQFKMNDKSIITVQSDSEVQFNQELHTSERCHWRLFQNVGGLRLVIGSKSLIYETKHGMIEFESGGFASCISDERAFIWVFKDSKVKVGDTKLTLPEGEII